MTTYTAITTGEIDIDSPLTQTLMTKMRDNPIAALEGDTSTPEILRQTQLLGTLTTTSGTTQTLSLLDLTNFRGLWVVVDGVSHDNVSGRTLRIAGSATAELSTVTQISSQTLSADVSIDLVSGEGFCISNFDAGTSNSATDTWIRPAITNATTEIVFSWNGAGNFDAGEIRVYGRK